MQRKLIGPALVGIAMTFGTAAFADSLQQCTRGRDVHARLKACQSVIDDRNVNKAARLRAHRHRGSLRAEAGRHAEAIEDFTFVIKARPADPRAYAQRGLAFHVIGKSDAALADLAKAVELDRSSDQYLLARGYLYLSQNRPAAAIADFDAALKRRPGNAVALNNRGLAHRKAGQLDTAIADYTAAIRHNPTYALAYANRGYAYEAMNDKQRAIADFKAALFLDKSLQGVTKALGRLGVKGAADMAQMAIHEGRVIVRVLCSGCHAVDAKSASPNPQAPPFRTLASRYPLLALREPLSRGIAAPHSTMPRFKISDADIDRVVAYINSLKAP
jgi:tetratricopeptide (TPR) repeat protein